MSCTSHHADLPGLLAAADMQVLQMCVLGTSRSLHVTCGALPVLPGREGLVRRDPGPSPLATLPKLSENDLSRAWLLCCPESHAGPQASEWPLLAVAMCMYQGRSTRRLLQLEQPSRCLLSHQGWPQNGHPDFSGLPCGARGTLCWAQPVLEWNYRHCWSGPWLWDPTCFVSGISWRAGHVAVCAGPEWGPEGSPWARSSYSLPPLLLWARWALSGRKAVLKHPPGSRGSSRPQMLRCLGRPHLHPVLAHRNAHGPGRQAQPRSLHAVPPAWAQSWPCRPFPHGGLWPSLNGASPRPSPQRLAT